MDTLPLIQRGFASLPAAVTACCFRADSACDDERPLQWPAAPHRPGGPVGPLGFTISADMTAALHAVCAAVPPCPPPADVGATAAWYRVSLRTDNVLSALKSLALPPHLSAARPKSAAGGRCTGFTLAGRLAAHAGHLRVRGGAAAERLARLAQALPAG